MSLAFSWIDFPEGRARFCGLVRGPDEVGRDVFAVEIGGRAGYGEIAKTYAGRDVSLAVVSFGYADRSQVGTPNVAASYDGRTAATVERLVRELVATVDNAPDPLDKPAALLMPLTTHFTGEVTFAAGWILIADVPAGAAE